MFIFANVFSQRVFLGPNYFYSPVRKPRKPVQKINKNIFIFSFDEDSQQLNRK